MSNSHTTEVVTGSIVLAAAVGFLMYAGQIVGLSGTSATHTYTASFRTADGISIGTDVRLGGVKVGAVTDITLNPDTFRADADFTVQSDVALPDDTAIIISSEGLLGGNYVELLPGGSPFNLDPGAEIEDTQGSVSLVQLLLKYVAGGEDSAE
ncbi:phospholipid/cholesterol/gamma-HCH transport system substrate-binding protein [Aliiroseovarius halocynthiae]|uniref:Outer membrane lipid asymmetry maintenance protein MlaD n=1 Tax=Aliiroseovarius halocynthiae TaxID=985055 RepID=A0A545SM28_9RHOB|nr:outer membrane lipid asymmetry maintenance protein MlaD [Aliiroseovarius halocynthiae]TQV66024.1 outer membrane lipid asymmetry maintenance protein MlaD [Aliiroseovarius halocynthiae]SMR83270.1 phospholipid/cholesterol/gamma-HCH transport system substrate-binding protein [Aliiroseovarius halocynthiae]